MNGRDLALIELDRARLPGWRGGVVRARRGRDETIDPRDRALAEQIRIGVIKNLLLLQHLIHHHSGRSLKSIDELVQTPTDVRLNFVFCQANREDFPGFIDFVAGRWPSLVGASSTDTGIVFSFVGSHTDVVPRSRELIPSFTEIMPSLLAGLARARALGLQVGGFDSMCGMPLCLVPVEERSEFSATELAAGAGDGEFVKGESCARCAEGQRCFGVRRGYAELYGTDELRPIAPAQSPFANT
jgi:hypothetical protein